MSGIFGQHLVRALVAQRVNRGAVDAGDHDDVALAVELLSQPLSGDLAPLVLVDMRVVGAWFLDDAVIGGDHHALVARRLNGFVKRGRRDRIDHDRLRARRHHRVDLLDLLLRVGTGDLNLEVDLVFIFVGCGEGLDHLSRLVLPVVADVAHREVDLVLVGRLRRVRRNASDEPQPEADGLQNACGFHLRFSLARGP